MYNPLPFLPKNFQKFIQTLKEKKFPPRIIIFMLGLLATIWFLIRVIPKPSRANYPCMQATAPFMSGFVLYLISSGGAVMAFKRFGNALTKSNYALAFVFLVIASFSFFLSTIQLPFQSNAGNLKASKSVFPPNDPFGEAKGIIPGRVVWMWDPDATNINCTNTSNGNGVIDTGDDAWFMEMNNDVAVIDSMIIKSLISLTEASDNAEAWELIFKFYNINHGNGNIGYTQGQKIFIKINATTAYGGLSEGRFGADLSRTDNVVVNPFASETNPYIVLSMLRQLVDVAQVPENMIYIGDPARNVYKEFFDLWRGEFPNVNILGNNLIHPEIDIVGLGRIPVVVSAVDKVFFSDHGTVMTTAITDKLFTIFDDMDYLINIPAMKAHSTAGITLAAKNHFGSFTRQWAMHLHAGLMDNTDDPVRLGYGLYRVQTDIMMHNLLSGKNLLILIDALYPGEDAQGVPFHWTSVPFDYDWCSSIFTSFDPVALESVCHDFLRTEYNGPTVAESRPNWFGVDDYLHQAADSTLWPENISYDPDNDGVLFASLGVHEHWNDSINKQYTRNLGTGEGIELYKAHDVGTGIALVGEQIDVRIFPNPTTDFISISNSDTKMVDYYLTDMAGKVLTSGKLENMSIKRIDMRQFNNGLYIIQLSNMDYKKSIKIIKQ